MDNSTSTSFNTTSLSEESEDETFGAYPIVVLCISAVIIIVLVLVGRFLCIKHKQEQKLKDLAEIQKKQNQKNDQKPSSTVEMTAGSTKFATVQSESAMDITKTDIVQSPNNEYQIGEHVQLKNGTQGTVRYVGPTTFSNDILYGIELDNEYEGEHNGIVKGIKYFDCAVPNKGIFVAVTDIAPLIGTETTIKTTSTQAEEKEYQIGDHVNLKDDRSGFVRYIGPTAFSKDTLFGIELNEKYEGEHDGKVKGVKYFDCNIADKGIFASKSDIL